MASTSYLARIIFAEFDGDVNEAIDFAGTYNLLVRAKSIPAPASAPNTVESTTLEDDTQTFEMGIKTSDSKEVTGNLEKTYLQAINKLSGKKLKIMQLYGTDGIGGVAKYAYIGQATATPSDVGGTDEILEMSATIIPNTSAVECTDDYKVVDNEDGTFAVTKVGGITSPDIEIPAAGQELYGKTVGDMVENGMEVLEDGTVKGTFKYVTDYTGFNGSEPDEQEGYFFPFTLKKSGTTMTFKKNGVPTKEDILFEANNVFHVTKSDTFTVAVDSRDVITFKFSRATFKSKGRKK